MPTRNVNLTEELDRFVLAKVESGRYENASEVVRAALRSRVASELHRVQAALDDLLVDRPRRRIMRSAAPREASCTGAPS